VGITAGSREVPGRKSLGQGISIIIIIIIIETTGILTRNLGENLETVPGKHSIDSLQKTAILGISQILRKVLHCEA